MNLKLTHLVDLPAIEVEIKYPEMNRTVEQLIRRVESVNHVIIGNDNGRQYRILYEDILYIESIEKKTFIYTPSQVFRSEQKLYQLLDELKPYEFVQISKACLLNINVVESFQALANSRIEVTLQDGEKLNVSRKYLPEIKLALSGEE